MICVRSLREGNFVIYTLGHISCAKRSSVHLRDIVALKDKHPYVFTEFMAGNFTVKITHAFST